MKQSRLWIGAGALGAAAIILVRRLLSKTDIRFNSLDPERAPDDDSQFIELQGLRVRVRMAGKGSPAVVLLHGFAASVFTWHKVFEALATYGTLIAFDRPAYGFTSRPIREKWNGRSPYSLEAQVDLTISLLDQFKIDRAILVGHSAGGTVATQTALSHPERVQSLVLISPAIYTDVPPPPGLHRLFDSSIMRFGGPLIARIAARFANPILNRAWHDPTRITAEIREGYLEPFRSEDWDKGMWEVARANRSAGLPHQIRMIQVPTLVVTGDDDHVVAVDGTKRLARELPNARLVVIADCGHIPQEERPHEFLDAVIPFIKSEPDDERR